MGDEKVPPQKEGTRIIRVVELLGLGGRCGEPRPELKERRARVKGFKKTRANLGLSQLSMAEALHIGAGTLRNWEYGRREIPEVAWVLAQLIHGVPVARKRLLAA